MFILGIHGGSTREDEDGGPGFSFHDGAAAGQPTVWELLDAFGERTGLPILLNTSFNNNAEPIVDSGEDSILCYLMNGLHSLVAGDWLVQKRGLANSDPACGALASSMRRHRKLVRRQERRNGTSEMHCLIESTANDFFCNPGCRWREISSSSSSPLTAGAPLST